MSHAGVPELAPAGWHLTRSRDVGGPRREHHERRCKAGPGQAATRWAFAQAQPGDAVLLSPACASLDMFRNYAHRADVFVATVHELMHESGGAA